MESLDGESAKMDAGVPGYQDVLEVICGRDVARFGARVKSYVAAPGMPGWHVRRSLGDGNIPPDTDVLCFHGYPRPWDLDHKI